jgi:adenosylcobinamide kinase / adenosylcobinamide-phosphate guanylyltransferase
MNDQPGPLSSGSLVRRFPKTTFVLGGAGSGKSALAETIANGMAGTDIRPCYLATAEPGDGEMAARIQRHQARRGLHWDTVQEPLELGYAIARESRPGRPVLVDCLTLWLSNILMAGRDPAAETAAVLAVMGHIGGPVVFVSNEVGQGIVPDNPDARAFRDYAGQLHQTMAAAAERVIFVIAGIPTFLKDSPDVIS